VWTNISRDKALHDRDIVLGINPCVQVVDDECQIQAAYLFGDMKYVMRLDDTVVYDPTESYKETYYTDSSTHITALYNISADPGESNDLSEQDAYQEVVSKMKKKIEAYAQNDTLARCGKTVTAYDTRNNGACNEDEIYYGSFFLDVITGRTNDMICCQQTFYHDYVFYPDTMS